MYCVRGTRRKVPSPIPDAAIPLAMPRFRSNQLARMGEYAVILIKVMPLPAVTPYHR